MKKVPFEVRQQHELAGLIALADKQPAMAAEEFSRANQQDPKILSSRPSPGVRRGMRRRPHRSRPKRRSSTASRSTMATSGRRPRSSPARRRNDVNRGARLVCCRTLQRRDVRLGEGGLKKGRRKKASFLLPYFRYRCAESPTRSPPSSKPSSGACVQRYRMVLTANRARWRT